MTAWSDADFTLTIPEIDLTLVSNIIVSITQGRVKVHKSDPEIIDEHHMAITLSQEETSVFSYLDPAEIQVNYLKSNRKRGNTETKQVPVFKNLFEDVIE